MNTPTPTNEVLKGNLYQAIDTALDDKSYTLENSLKTNDFIDKLTIFTNSNPEETKIPKELVASLAELGNFDILVDKKEIRSIQSKKRKLSKKLEESIKKMIDLIKQDNLDNQNTESLDTDHDSFTKKQEDNKNTEVQKDEKLSEKDIDAYKKFMSMQKEALRVEAEQTEEVEAILIRLNELASEQEYLDLISDFSPLTYNEKLGCKADEVLIIQDRAKTFLTGFLKKTPKEYGCFSKEIITSDKVQKFIIDRTKSEALENEIFLPSNDESIVNDDQVSDICMNDIQPESYFEIMGLCVNESSPV